MEYGLDETYARLFVSNVKKHAPTKEYQLNQIDKIPDGDFCDKLPDIMKAVWVDGEIDEALSERYGLDRETLQCIIGLTSNALNDLSRGHVTKENLLKDYIQHMSKKKTDIRRRYIKSYLQRPLTSQCWAWGLE